MHKTPLCQSVVTVPLIANLLNIIFTVCWGTDCSGVIWVADKLIMSKMDVVVVGSCMTDLVRFVAKTEKLYSNRKKLRKKDRR